MLLLVITQKIDWPFLFERADILGMDITEFAITLNRISKIKRKPSTVNLVVKPNIITNKHGV
jgi:hypothetical protein